MDAVTRKILDTLGEMIAIGEWRDGAWCVPMGVYNRATEVYAKAMWDRMEGKG